VKRLQHFICLFYLVLVIGIGCTPAEAARLSSKQLVIRPCSPSNPTTGLTYQQIRERIRKSGSSEYRQSLEGKLFDRWSGWVVQVDHVRVAVDMDEYEADLTLNEYEGVRRTGLTDVILEGVSDGVVNQWHVGNRIIFSGLIREVRESGLFEIDPAAARYAVIVTANDIQLDEGKNTKDSCGATAIYPIITLTQPNCTMTSSDCHTMGITVLGNGTVIYTKRDWGTDETVRKTAQISESQVRQLVQAFLDVDYFSLSDNYDGYDWSDSDSATTSITFADRRKSIFCYYGDLSAPPELRELEEMIVEIVDVEQFEW
jgi:hypothetical protein